MKTFKSSRQLDTESKELVKHLEKECNKYKEALQRIKNTYDNIEDLAGVIAKEALAQ